MSLESHQGDQVLHRQAFQASLLPLDLPKAVAKMLEDSTESIGRAEVAIEQSSS